VLKPFLDEMQSRFEKVMGGEEGMGVDLMGMIIDMPLTSILMFQQAVLSTSVDEIVNDLLVQAHALDG
jgi:beta-glucosidase